MVDNVGVATFAMSLRSLRKGGRLLTVGNTSGPIVELDNRLIFSKHLQIIGTTMGPIRAYRKVMSLIFEGKLNPTIDTVYPLSRGIEAFRRWRPAAQPASWCSNPKRSLQAQTGNLRRTSGRRDEYQGIDQTGSDG